MDILVLDDEKGFRDELKEFLEDNEHMTYPAAKPSVAFEILNQHNIDIAIVDIRLPEMDGLDVLSRIKTAFPDIEVIMITGHGDMDCVIKALKRGAIDFFNKPFQLKYIQQSIEKTTNFIHLNKKLNVSGNGFSLISKELEEKIGFPFISENPLMKTVVRLMSMVANSDHTTVLVTGESGTGKELVARGIHYLSARKNNSIHAINCSTIPDELFESEFFGHKAGSFTNAVSDKKGWFEVADGGTLFLDEIADLKLGLQPKFLRVLEDKLISKVGDTTKQKVNVRIVAATNYDLKKLVGQKEFRSDLYHRLNSFVIHIPPLRERKEDIPLLLKHFMKEYANKMQKKIVKVEKKVIDQLMQHNFPGNVRELKHMVENAVIFCRGKELRTEHFVLLSQQMNSGTENKPTTVNTFNLEHIERNTITLALQKTNFNKSQTASLLHITRQALDRKIKKLNIDIHRTQ